jgi:hypothetical protein
MICPQCQQEVLAGARIKFWNGLANIGLFLERV